MDLIIDQLYQVDKCHPLEASERGIQGRKL